MFISPGGIQSPDTAGKKVEAAKDNKAIYIDVSDCLKNRVGI